MSCDNFKSPRKDHQRGRGNSRDNQNGRNRSLSKERVGEKSPRDLTGRVKTGISEEELEEILKELKTIGGNRVNRVRKQLFEDEDEDDLTPRMMRRIRMVPLPKQRSLEKEEEDPRTEEDLEMELTGH